jgi:hypothetical protein
MNNTQPNAHTALKVVAGELMDWSTNILGDLEKRVKKIKRELETCRRMAICPNQVVREEILRFKLEQLEEQIDLYWKQRAHVRCLQEGTEIPPFFRQRAQRGGGEIKSGD